MIVAALESPKDIECQSSNLKYYRIINNSIDGPFIARLEIEFDDYTPVGPDILVEWSKE